MNYGAIGSLIASQITLGFNDQGSQFDENGNLDDWWEPQTAEAFKEKAKCIIDQYGNLPEQKIGLDPNVIDTRGEIIADNGGFKIAYKAYQKYTRVNGVEKKLPGLNYSTNQLFWISAAQTWCEVIRPKEMKSNIPTDSHSANKLKVLGSFANLKEFSTDFKCRKGTKMNPEKKCEVW